MSDQRMEDFLNPSLATDMRFHEIKWSKSHFTRDYFAWVPGEYLGAENDYPFMQFMVSTSLGRVVGFIDEDSVFQIIALDPLHNIQIAKGHEARHDCKPVQSDYMDLQERIDKAIGSLDGDDPAKAIAKARAHLLRACLGHAVDGRVWVTVELHESDADDLHKHMAARPGLSISKLIAEAHQTLLLADYVPTDGRSDGDGDGG